MQHISRFLSDNFLENHDEESKRKVISPSRKKQMEERKFYQELDREEIMEKNTKHDSHRMSSLRNQNRISSKHDVVVQERQDENTTSARDSASLVSDKILMSTIVAKDKVIANKEKEIARLEKELKTNTNAKAFAKRFAKFEKDKEEEIEDIKSHYKSMMENLAKQIQKANGRHDDEIKKNTKLREAMDEMRHDMAGREQDLENKILALGKLVKEGNNVKDKLEKKIENLEKKVLESEKMTQDAYAFRNEYADRMKLREVEFELERKEMVEEFGKEKKLLEEKVHQVEDSLRDSKKSLQKQLSETTEKLEDEEQKHEQSILRLQRAERSLHEKENQIKYLELKLNETEIESMKYRKKVEKDMKTIESWKQTKSLESKDNNMIHFTEKMNLQADLKEVTSKLETAQRKIALLEDHVKQKTGALRRKTDELESLQNQLKSTNMRYTKDERQRDIIAVKDRRKLECSEAALRKELEDIKTSPEYIRMVQLSQETTTLPNDLEHSTNEELLEAIQRLQAEKTSLELKLSSVTLRHNESQKQLELALDRDDTCSDASKQQCLGDSKGGITSSFDQNASPKSSDSNSSTEKESSAYRPSSRRSTTPVRSRALSQVRSQRSIFSTSD